MTYKKICDVTPEELRCGVGACPAIYEGTRELSAQMCGIGTCPALYKSKREGEGVYLIIGKMVNPREAGLGDLEKKIGPGEALIEVPRELIDNRGT